jgi:hypothetical protein
MQELTGEATCPVCGSEILLSGYLGPGLIAVWERMTVTRKGERPEIAILKDCSPCCCTGEIITEDLVKVEYISATKPTS